MIKRKKAAVYYLHLDSVLVAEMSNGTARRERVKIPLLSSPLVECTRGGKGKDKIWTEAQLLLTDLSIQRLRQCQIAAVINVKKFVTCSIQRKNNWIIFGVSCRDNSNNSSCKGQKSILMM